MRGVQHRDSLQHTNTRVICNSFSKASDCKLLLIWWLSNCLWRREVYCELSASSLRMRLAEQRTTAVTNKTSWPTHTAALNLIQLYDEENNSVLSLFHLKIPAPIQCLGQWWLFPELMASCSREAAVHWDFTLITQLSTLPPSELFSGRRMLSLLQVSKYCDSIESGDKHIDQGLNLKIFFCKYI